MSDLWGRRECERERERVYKFHWRSVKVERGDGLIVILHTVKSVHTIQ